MKSVLVTGATGSLGRAIVEQFGQSGRYKVFGTYLNNRFEAARLTQAFSANLIQLDITTSADFDRLPNEVDILINNAGVNITSEFVADVERESWDRTVSINLNAPFLLSKRYLPAMVAKGWGRVINVSSIYAVRGSIQNGPYNASKHGLSGLTKSIALEYFGSGITANEVAPGPVDSDMLDRIIADKAKSDGTDPITYKKALIGGLRQRRLTTPAEVAFAVSFLADERADGINGIVMPVDGGMTA